MKRFISILVCFLAFSFPISPKIFSAQAESYSKAECVVECQSGRILYGENVDKKLPMASTTKILTAICALENIKDIDESFSVPKQCTGIEGSSVYLQEGETVTARELLYGLMLRSGNDAAETLAFKTSGNLTDFGLLMNKTAEKAGALNSHFVTPHGLPNDEHYTTAYDLSMITAYALKNDTFREIVSTKYYENRGWKNKNKMLTLCEGAIGVKTGYTKKAGRCLVSAVQRENMTLICTVLSCSDTYKRSMQLIGDAFAKYQNTVILSKDTPVETTKMNGKKVLAHTLDDVVYPILEEERPYLKRNVIAYEKSKRDKNGEIVGKIEITLSNKLIFSGNLYKL